MSQVMMPTRRRSKQRHHGEILPTKQRVVNSKLLILSAVVVAALGVCAYFWHGYRATIVAGAFDERAALLEKEGRWNDAAFYLSRHLRFNPDDLDARVRLIDAVERTAASPAQQRKLITLLYETLGQSPERHDLRLKLAEQLLESGRIAESDKETRKFIVDEEKSALEKLPGEEESHFKNPPSEEQQQAAKRIQALSLARQARPGGVVDVQTTLDALQDVLQRNPGDVAIAAAAATLCQTYPTHVRGDAVATADRIMDDLLAANPNNVEALIARHVYLVQSGGKSPNETNDDRRAKARADIEAALKLEPENIEALILAADDEISAQRIAGQDLSGAEAKLLKVIELKPSDARGYIALARLHAIRGKRDEAVDVLRRGREKLDPHSFEILQFDAFLAGILIESNRLEEAERALANFDDSLRQRLPELSTEGRLRLENSGRMLRAKLYFVRNDLDKVTRELNAIIASVGQADTAAAKEERRNAYIMRAGLMAKLGRTDLAAADWKTIAADAQFANGPQAEALAAEARLRAAAALLELDRAAEAIAELEQYCELPNPSPQAWLLLAQAHLRLQAKQPAPSWHEFDTAIAEAKTRLPGRWEPYLTEVLYWHAKGEKDGKSKAIGQLERLEKDHPADKELLARLVFCYEQLNELERADRALNKYEELDASSSRGVLLRAALLAQRKQIDEALKLLAESAASAAPADQLQLKVAHIRLLLSSNKGQAAHEEIAALIAASPKDRSLLALGLEIALAREDFATAEKWEGVLKELNVSGDFEWRYYRASRLAAQFATLEAGAKAELESLVESLRSERPAWYPVVALAGQYAELAGNRRQAIDAYQSAVELGDRRPKTFERLVNALAAEGRFSDASAYLSRLGSDHPIANQAESMAIAAAYKDDGIKAALEMAQKAVDRGSNDPMHHVWLAHLLSLDGQDKRAESVFQEAIKRFPTDNQVWNGLFTYLVRTKQPDRARRALAKWTESVTTDETAKNSILAQGYEVLRDTEAAKQHYEAVIAKDPANTDARLRLAKLLLASDVVAARGHFEQVLKLDPKNGEARHHLATLLAVTDQDGDWNRAVSLLTSGDKTDRVSVAGGDDRLRAMLISRRGKNRPERLENCEAARNILAARVAQATSDAIDLDRMLLANIYEQEAAMQEKFEDYFKLLLAARDTLRPLVDRENPPADYLVSYIRLLLRHLERQHFVNEVSATQEQRQVFIDDARLRNDELKAALSKNPSDERAFLPTAFHVRLLVAEGNRDQGVSALAQFADERLPEVTADAERAKLLLQLGNLATTIGAHAEAEAWYRQLLKIAPNSYVLLAKSLVSQNRLKEAAEICLSVSKTRPPTEVATVLAQLVPVGADAELDRHIEPLLNTALNSSSDNVELLMSLAVRHVTEDEYDEAISLFRRIVELQPNHALALNNLATLLAERPADLAEAQKYVEHAMATAGRSPALLDTLGTILIRAGNHEKAIAALEEATAGAARDPRYYFHLAVAYQRSGHDQKARDTFVIAQRNGLDQAILTSGDRELLASLNYEPLSTTLTK